MQRILAVVIALASPVAVAVASEPSHDPRYLFRLDASYLTLPNLGVEGGGGVRIPPTGDTAAGLVGGGGVETGLEARLSAWLGLDVGVAWYRPTLEVDRVPPAPGARLDSRSAPVDLRRAQLGLVLAPPALRGRLGRLAFAALVARSTVAGVPSSLGLAVDGAQTGFGADVRGEVYLSKERRWGVGAALAFSHLGPGFVDLETGSSGTLQASGFFLRVGLRGSW